MTATHCVKNSDGDTVGFIVDGVFYTDYKVKENIQFIDNMSFRQDGGLAAAGILEETTYHQAVNMEQYARLIKENSFVRDIQKELEEWKQDELHKVLQLDYLYMYPLSFREFRRALDREEMLENLDLYGKSNEAEYTELYSCYELYKQIGGYPEAVKAFVRTHDIGKCREVMNNLLITFEKESRNYFKESREPMVFRAVYMEAIKEMCREKRGSGNRLVELVTNIARNSQKQMISRDEVSNAVAWLVYSGIVGECGLYRNGDVNDYIPARRLYYMDCGIASYVAGQTALPRDSVEGFLTENFVYTEL